jgi:hypothetical protein
MVKFRVLTSVSKVQTKHCGTSWTYGHSMKLSRAQVAIYSLRNHAAYQSDILCCSIKHHIIKFDVADPIPGLLVESNIAIWRNSTRPIPWSAIALRDPGPVMYMEIEYGCREGDMFFRLSFTRTGRQ